MTPTDIQHFQDTTLPLFFPLTENYAEQSSAAISLSWIQSSVTTDCMHVSAQCCNHKHNSHTVLLVGVETCCTGKSDCASRLTKSPLCVCVRVCKCAGLLKTLCCPHWSSAAGAGGRQRYFGLLYWEQLGTFCCILQMPLCWIWQWMLLLPENLEYINKTCFNTRKALKFISITISISSSIYSCALVCLQPLGSDWPSGLSSHNGEFRPITTITIRVTAARTLATPSTWRSCNVGYDVFKIFCSWQLSEVFKVIKP